MFWAQRDQSGHSSFSGKATALAFALLGGVWGGFWTHFVVNVNERCATVDRFNTGGEI